MTAASTKKKTTAAAKKMNTAKTIASAGGKRREAPNTKSISKQPAEKNKLKTASDSDWS
jgi:hypothetical protein